MKNSYLQPAFLICITALAVSGAGMSYTIKKFGVHLQKQPLYLRKPLDLLDQKSLAPYKVIKKQLIEDADTLKTLGTKDYIQWLLVNTAEPVNSDVRKCLLFITYYSLPDRVPHVPEECYAGSGFQKLHSGSATLNIKKEAFQRIIPAKELVFQQTGSHYWRGSKKFSVFYIFNVKGKNAIYANSREDARIALNKNILGKHSYFCKIEWFFLTKSGVRTYPDNEKAISASETLLGAILPVLEQEHWPNDENGNSESIEK